MIANSIIFFNGYFPSIVVTAPAGSIVTCTTPNGIVLNTIEVSGTWIFDKLRTYGTYIITATDGIKTINRNIVVDSAIKYSIEIYYRLYIYEDGDKHEEVTGGLHKITNDDGYSYGSLTFKENGSYNRLTFATDHIEMKSYNIWGVAFKPINKIDFTNLTKLYIEAKSSNGANASPILFIGNDSVLYNNIEFEVVHDSNDYKTYEFSQPSQVTGLNDFIVMVYSGRTCSISKIWFE